MPTSTNDKTVTTSMIYRFMPIFCCLLLLLAFALTGCAGSSVSPTRITTVPPYSACLTKCNSMMGESAYVRDGCRRGCELALEDFSLRGAHYASRQSCIDSVEALNHAQEMNSLQTRCENTWAGEERRAGCDQAGSAFYQAITLNLCISDMR